MSPLVPTLITAALLAAPLPGDKPKFPQGTTPTIAAVADIDKDAGTCTLRTISVKAVTVNREVVENVNGMLVKKVVPVTSLVRACRQ
jgi:hypothetical protein